MRRLDQEFREQPTLFDAVTIVVPTNEEGKRSRDETYRSDVLPELTDREREIYARIAAAGRYGITIDEISAATQRPANAFSGRVTSLAEKGRVRYTRERRPTRSGSTASVIVAVEFLGEPFLPAMQPASEATMKTGPSLETMPDQVTCSKTPRDQNGDLLRVNRQYQICGFQVKCFEDDAGNLLIQKCTRGGSPVPGSTPQFVRDLPNDARPFLLVGPQFE